MAVFHVEIDSNCTLDTLYFLENFLGESGKPPGPSLPPPVRRVWIRNQPMVEEIQPLYDSSVCFFSVGFDIKLRDFYSVNMSKAKNKFCKYSWKSKNKNKLPEASRQKLVSNFEF